MFELGIGGGKEVYFPNEQCWRAKAPAWALDQWQRYADARRAGGAEQHPLLVEHDAHFEEERAK